ncbi:MAG: glycosyltransferase family 9 protein [Candidatus Omnitrophica bacterium]|nr:glycosyltransferase family 9 protein [Candidatus Omnitrophota bacterium]
MRKKCLEIKGVLVYDRCDMIDKIKKILIIRNDRVGDVVLSTPAFRALRRSFPDAHLVVLVQPYTQELVCENPDIDETIVYDKQKEYKTQAANKEFIQRLKEYDFDAVIIFNPSLRMNLITFLARIKYRIGYTRKWGRLLLTHCLRDSKGEGAKHEFEYVLDLVRFFGQVVETDIIAKDTSLYVPLPDKDSRIVDDYLKEKNISSDFAAIHPWASCPSKIWPQERIIELCLKIKNKFDLDPVIICGLADLESTKMLIARIAEKGLNTHLFCHSLGKLAWLFKKSKLLVSNDSGPVHIAAAVGTPVISIFGRNLAGLGPARWAPLGNNNIILHNPNNCVPCRAHNCPNNFACLEAVTVDDVLKAVGEILKKIASR